MSIRPLATLLLTLAVSLIATPAHAEDILAPVKDYAKPDEPIAIKFLQTKDDTAKQAFDKLGLPATKLTDLFSNAPKSEVFDDHGAPKFSLYQFDGTKLDPTPGKLPDDGKLDLASIFPQVKNTGTYVLVWNDATPLLIETLNNPGRSKADLARMQDQLNGMSDADKKDLMRQFQPTVTHFELLQYAAIETEKGVIKARFSYDAAPHTVDNFISLAKQGFYDNTVFHRIIAGFMIQGGDSTGNIDNRAGTGGPGYDITAEFSDKKHERGTLSMARAQDPDSAGSQFFIMLDKTPSLDGQYSAFGDVFDGMPVVDEIAKTPVSDNNGTVLGHKPVIEHIKILPATLTIYGISK